ncbi:MAG: hypothetical protein J6P61_02335 [Erysipelotrichaceae bacterium]|nr:hypothetical protein [Erysipelotrichaceae bacterium]
MLRETHHMGITDCDYKGRVRPEIFFIVFGEIATVDAMNLGLYRPDMVGRYGWVVVQQTLKLNEPVYEQDEITFNTRTCKSSLAVFNRYYTIEKEGRQIGECYSYWTLIDLEKRMMARAKKLGLPMEEEFKMPGRPKKLKPMTDYDTHTTYTVKYSDTDTNNHMNNTRYVRLASDMIDYDYYENHTLKEISINYRKEIPAMSTFDVFKKQTDDQFMIEGRMDDDVCFTMEMIFEAIKND